MIDEAVQKAGKNVPVVFDESVQLVVCNDISFCKSCICQFQLTFYALVQECPHFLLYVLFKYMRAASRPKYLLMRQNVFRKFVHS